jgi:hypothetical protein
MYLIVNKTLRIVISGYGTKPKVLNPSNFGLIPLHITGFLVIVIFSMYLHHLISGFLATLCPLKYFKLHD